MKTKLMLLSLLLPLIAVTMGSAEDITIKANIPSAVIRGRSMAIGDHYYRPELAPDIIYKPGVVLVEGDIYCGPSRSFQARLHSDGSNMISITIDRNGSGGVDGDTILIGPVTTMVGNRYPADVMLAGDSRMSGNVYFGSNTGITAGKVPAGSGKLEIANAAHSGNLQILVGSTSYGPYLPTEAPIDEIYIGGGYTQAVRIEASNFIIPGTAPATSDITLKKDIVTIPDALDKVCRLRGVNFRWKDKKRPSLRMGLIGQEVERVFPEVVDTDKNGLKSVQYAALAAALVESAKEQQKEIEELKKKLELIEPGTD